MKLTQDEVNEIKAARYVGLTDAYSLDGYVYLITNDGQDASWHGFSGNLNSGVDSPYLVCQMHNADSWEQLGDMGEGDEIYEDEDSIDWGDLWFAG